MEDIFNFDKFLLIGTKGTGKTAFYLALRDKDFLNNLKIKANKKQTKFTSIDIISAKEHKERNKYFEVSTLNSNNITNKEFFYKRFWVIYILNSILLSRNKLNGYTISNSISTILPQILNDTTTNKLFFEDIIKNDKKFILIEKELENIDLHLKKLDLNLMITFDQLDYIVKPINWSEVVSPLINYCRSMPYLKIQPKIFMRRDLFDKYIKLTNKKSLNSKIIDLEWSKDEIFAFFFKFIFAYAKDNFFIIMKEYNDINKDQIESIKDQIEKPNSYNQIDLDKYKIISLVNTFFGEYPNPNNTTTINYSKSHDWFYESLADANNTISLRPFLDLIKFAIQDFLDKGTRHNKPILHPHFYNHRDTRRSCIENYFNDLANEEGNEDFKNIIEHISNSLEFPKEFKYRKIYGYKYNKFFNYFLENKNIELKYCTKISDIEEILKLNGAISIHYTQKSFSFAYLYKYYLGLKG